MPNGDALAASDVSALTVSLRCERTWLILNPLMPSAADHQQTIRHIYSELASGRPAALLENLDEQVRWEFGGIDHGIDWLVPGVGRKYAEMFLQAAAGLEFHEFVVQAVMADEHWVVGLLTIEFSVKCTGKRVREECQAQIWRFGSNGRIVAVRHAADTHQHWLALTAGD